MRVLRCIRSNRRLQSVTNNGAESVSGWDQYHEFVTLPGNLTGNVAMLTDANYLNEMMAVKNAVSP